MTRILVVDDDRATRHVLTSVLEQAGFDVSGAKDGVDALAKLARRRFDLMLLDVWMPRMNGLDLLTRLRARKRRPRVIVMTSDDTPETVLKAVKEQAMRYVHKPVTPEALVETVRDALQAPRDRADRGDLGAAGLGGDGRAVHARVGRPHSVGDGPSRHRSGARAARVDRLCAARAGHERGGVGWQARSVTKGPHRVPARAADALVPHRRPGSRASTSTTCRIRRSAILPRIRWPTCSCARKKAFGRAASAS